METLFSWIERELSPPGIRQGHRRSLYRIIGRISQQVADDIALSKREFFAHTTTKLDAHGRSKNIPRLPFDSDASYRSRLVSPVPVLSSAGEATGLAAFLNSYVPGRWFKLDTARDSFKVGSSQVGKARVGRTPALVLYLTDLIPSERQDIKVFLDWFLGVDIEFVLLRHGRADEGSLTRFLDAYVRGRWEKIDKTEGFFKVGTARVGIAHIASEIRFSIRVSALTEEEKREIEEFLEWFLGEKYKAYKVVEGSDSDEEG